MLRKESDVFACKFHASENAIHQEIRLTIGFHSHCWSRQDFSLPELSAATLTSMDFSLFVFTRSQHALERLNVFGITQLCFPRHADSDLSCDFEINLLGLLSEEEGMKEMMGSVVTFNYKATKL